MSKLIPYSGPVADPNGLVPFEGLLEGEKASVLRRYFADPAVSAAKGVVGLGEAALGLADMPTLGYAGKLAEQVGIRPKEWQQSLESLYSQEQKAANQAVQEAQGFIPTAKAMLENPSTLAHGIIENAPSMVGGGLIARGLVKAAPKVISTLTGAGIGEGAITAGQNTEQVRQASETGLLTPEQVGLMAVSGALTGGIGRVSGGIAKKFGFQNLEEMIAGGKLDPTAPVRGPLARAVGGFLTEGALEELPQSSQEQVAINLAQGKPWDEGVGSAAAQGLLIGGLMGAGGNVLFGQRRADGTTVPPGQPAPPALPPPPPQGFPPPTGGAAPPALPLTDAAATAVATGAADEAQTGREQEAAAAQQPPEGAPAAPTGGETPPPTGPISGAITPTAEKPVAIEEATKLKEEREAATGLVQNITPSPIQSDKFTVQPTTTPAPPNPKVQQAATKEAEAAQKQAWAGLDQRISTFKAEAKDLEQKAKATKGDGEPQLPAMFKALSVVSNPVWDPKAATRAVKTAIDGKRPDVAIAIVERAERAAVEAAAAKPSVPETNGMYVPIQKMLQKKADAARKAADKLAIAAGLQPGAGNAIQKPSASGVLPRQPEGTGVPGSISGGVGQGQQGPQVAGPSQVAGQAPTPVVGQAENVQGNPPNGQVTQAGSGQVVNPLSVVEDDGDVPNARVALFSESGDAHLRYVEPQDGKVHVLGIYAADGVRGKEMLRWLSSKTGKAIVADEVAIPARGFWNKMKQRGLVESISANKYAESVKADPLDQLVEHDIQEVDDTGKPTGRTARAKVPAREALADIDERYEFAKAMLDCLGT